MPGAGTDHDKPLITGGPVIVLVRPQLAENIGMVARAMANFGLSELRLVAPREAWPASRRLKKGAHAAASGANHVLDSARLFQDFRSAVADLHKIYATTARGRGQAKPVTGADGAAAEIKARIDAGQKIGIIFGPERTGLENDEIAMADALISFPVNPGFASLNLAQAVLLTGYEWFKAAHSAAPPFDIGLKTEPATRDMVLSFYDFLETELEEVGFFNPEHRTAIMRRNLRNIFHRIGLTEGDVRTLRGAMASLAGKRRRAEKPEEK